MGVCGLALIITLIYIPIWLDTIDIDLQILTHDSHDAYPTNANGAVIMSTK